MAFPRLLVRGSGGIGTELKGRAARQAACDKKGAAKCIKEKEKVYGAGMGGEVKRGLLLVSYRSPRVIIAFKRYPFISHGPR